MTPSPEQQSFFDRLLSSTDNIQLRAAAGSGKTTTICHAVGLLPKHLSVRFLAFNKNIATELRERLPMSCQVETFHAAGYRAWIKHNGGKRVAPNGDKLAKILKDRLKGKDWELYFSFCCRLTSLAKNMGMDTPLLENSFSNWQAIALHHDQRLQSDDADESRAIEICMKLLAESNATAHQTIDFDDMLYVPLRLGIQFDKVNVVFIDEAQDTNGVQRALLHRMVAAKPFGRLIAVGDDSQAIYGFRGADSDAMEVMKQEFEMSLMPLSVSYRCSKAVVKEAQKFCK